MKPEAWPRAWPGEWRPPAPFRAEMRYVYGDADADPLWLMEAPVGRRMDLLGRRWFLGFGPAGKPVRFDGVVCGVPGWAAVHVVKTLNRHGVPVFARCERGLQ